MESTYAMRHLARYMRDSTMTVSYIHIRFIASFHHIKEVKRNAVCFGRGVENTDKPEVL